MPYGDAGEQTYLKIELEPLPATPEATGFLLDPGFRGGVTVGAHAGWSKVREIAFRYAPMRAADGAQADREPSTPAINEIVVSKPTDCTSPLFFKVCTAGRHVVAGRPMRLTAKLDVTRIDGDGREITVVSVTMHDVVIARDTAPPSVASAAMEGFRLRYRRMTYAGLPRSSPDVSQVVRDVWLPARPHRMPRWPREI